MLRLFWTVAVVAICGNFVGAADKDSPSAAATRKKLQIKISVDYKEVRIKEVMDDIKSKVKDATDQDLSIQLDNPGGVSNNLTLTYTATDKSVADILDGMFKKNDMGYIVISKEYKTFKGRYDGWLLIVKGKERGYPAGQEPAAATEKDPAKKPAPDPEKDPAKKPAAKEPPKPTTEDAPDTKTEQEAGRKLKYARMFADDGNVTKAKDRCKEIITKYPKTKAAEDAKKLLEKLEDK